MENESCGNGAVCQRMTGQSGDFTSALYRRCDSAAPCWLRHL